MRKKTIKSYFFKKSLKNPSTSTLFCFSKRSIKQKKIIIDGGNVQKYKNRRDFFNDSAKNEKKYKFYVTHLIKYNQWSLNKDRLVQLFRSSCFKKKLNDLRLWGTKVSAWKQIHVWYLLKVKYCSNLNKKIKTYPETGMLSSHFVHFLTKKNVTYQTKSKYNSKIMGLNCVYFYPYLYARISYAYVNSTKYKINFFTLNPTKQNMITDENFNITASLWSVNTSFYKRYVSNKKLTASNHTSFLSNSLEYNLRDYKYVCDHKNDIIKYLFESDLQKKDAHFSNLVMPNKNIMHILPIVNNFLKLTSVYKITDSHINLLYMYALFSKV